MKRQSSLRVSTLTEQTLPSGRGRRESVSAETAKPARFVPCICPNSEHETAFRRG